MNALSGKKIGVAMTGSFCTFAKAFAVFERLKDMGASLLPVMSETAYATDTRFGAAAAVRARFAALCGAEPLHTIADAEPIGPRGLVDLLLVAPCTGNTLSKIACGITDTSVTMACKSVLRTGAPVVLAVATNDALTGSMPSLAHLSERKNVYFVPLVQDSPSEKPGSCVFCVKQAVDAVLSALERRQIRPIFLENRVD